MIFCSSNNAVSSGVSVSTAITTSSINTSSLTGAKSSATKTSSSQVSSATSNTAGTGSVSSAGATNAAGNGASNVVQNIPQLVSSYMPAFYQQSYLPFEDMQLVQPRTMTYYYDQTTPTSLAGVRSDGTTPNLASVAYPTMSADGRFARTENSSPVQSQQTAGSAGQTMMNATMMNPPYAYFYGTNVMPGGFQQFPQIYSVSVKSLFVNCCNNFFYF